MRPLRMPRHQRLLPGRQVGVELGQRLRRLLLDLGDLVADVAAIGGECAQLVDLGLEFGDGLFEIEIAAHLIGHRNNIGTTALSGEAVLQFRKKVRVFNDLASIRTPAFGRGEFTPGGWLRLSA
jgi:hypothetical protein